MGIYLSSLIYQRSGTQQKKHQGECKCHWEYFLTRESHNFIQAITCSSDGQLIALAINHNITIHNAQTGLEVGYLPGHQNLVTAIAFCENGSLISSGCSDGTIIIWDIKSKTQIKHPYLRNAERIRTVLFSTNSQYIAAQSCDSQCKIWNLNEGQISIVKCRIQSFDFALNSKTIAFAIILRQCIVLQNLMTRKQQLLFYIRKYQYVHCVRFSPNGKIIAIGSGNRIKICDHQTNKMIIQFKGGEQTFSFSPQGDFLISGSEDGTIRLWNIIQRKEANLRGHQFPIKKVAFSPNGKYVYSLDSVQNLKVQEIQ